MNSPSRQIHSVSVSLAKELLEDFGGENRLGRHDGNIARGRYAAPRSKWMTNRVGSRRVWPLMRDGQFGMRSKSETDLRHLASDPASERADRGAGSGL